MDWEVAVFVKNVGDTQFITSGFENITDYAEGSISRPREWGLPTLKCHGSVQA